LHRRCDERLQNFVHAIAAPVLWGRRVEGSATKLSEMGVVLD